MTAAKRNGPHDSPSCLCFTHAGPVRIAPSHEAGPCRGTDRLSIETVKHSRLACQAIQNRSFQIWVAIEADIAVALVIGKNEHNIRPISPQIAAYTACESENREFQWGFWRHTKYPSS